MKVPNVEANNQFKTASSEPLDPNWKTTSFGGSSKKNLSDGFVYKLIDLGSAIGLAEVGNESIGQATASLMTFSTLEFAG